MTEEDFRPVVKLLLARMHSSPEEFQYDHYKYSGWMRICADADSWGTEAEKFALENAVNNIRMGQLHSKAMQHLLREDQDDGETIPSYNYDRTEASQKARAAVANSSSQWQAGSLNPYSTPYGDVYANQYDAQLAAQMPATPATTSKPKNWWHK